MSKQKITLGEVLTFHTVLDHLKGFTNSEFNYFVAKNLELTTVELKPYFKVVNDIESILKPFTEEKAKALEECAVKNKMGEPEVAVLPNGSLRYNIQGNEASFKDKLDALKTKHKTIIDKHGKELKESEKLLEKQVQFSPYRMKRTFIPDGVPTEVYKLLFPYLD